MKDKEHYENSLKEIMQGAGINFILILSGYVLTFIFTLFVARYFGKTEFGYYQLITTLLGFFVLISLFGLQTSVLKFIPEYKAKKEFSTLKGFLRFCFAVPFMISFIIFLVLFFLADFISGLINFGPVFAELLRIISFFIPIKIVSNLMSFLFQANKMMFIGNFGYNVLERIVILLGIIVIVSFDLDIVWLILVLAISLLSSFIYHAIMYRLKISFKINEKPKYLLKIWFKFTVPLFFTGLLVYVLGFTDYFVISAFLTAGDLGVYSISYSLGAYLLAIPTMFLGIFTAVLTEAFIKNKKVFRLLFNKIQEWVFGLTLVPSLIFIFFSKEIIDLLFGQEYLGGYESFVVLSVFYVISVFFTMHQTILLINKDTNFFFVNTLVLVCINIILNILLVQSMGILGVAFASGFSILVLRFSEYIRSGKYHSLKLDFVYATKITCSGIIAILVSRALYVYVVASLGLNPIIKLIVVGLVYLVITTILLFVLKTFKKDDFEFMLLIEEKIGLNLGFIKRILKRFV